MCVSYWQDLAVWWWLGGKWPFQWAGIDRGEPERPRHAQRRQTHPQGPHQCFKRWAALATLFQSQRAIMGAERMNLRRWGAGLGRLKTTRKRATWADVIWLTGVRAEGSWPLRWEKTNKERLKQILPHKSHSRSLGVKKSLTRTLWEKKESPDSETGGK